jgi:hypothetical protein
MEHSLARAHRALFDAFTAAEAAGDEGAALDIGMLSAEVVRVAEGSLRGKAPKAGRLQIDGKIRGQLSLP